MTHFASSRFWERYAELPEEIRALANKSYELLKNDPRHPSLHFKSSESSGRLVLACTIVR